MTASSAPLRKRQNIALLLGGWSKERDVSLNKGKAVEKALIQAGYTVRTIDVTQDLPALVAALTPAPDAVFNNLHGRGGEDGIIQSVLEMLGIPYSHSGVLASAIAMDKPVAKQLAQNAGVRVPEGVVVPRATLQASGSPIPAPFVVKPPNEGSSVGVRIVLEGDNHPAVDDTMPADLTEFLVERYIPGRELTVAVLDGRAQDVTEIRAMTRFFDYEAKYNDTRTDYILPAPLPENVRARILRDAEAVYKAVGCRGLARCDFRYNDAEGENGIYFLEINTQPGCTPESIGPSQVIRHGMSFVDLCAHLVETATCQTEQTEKEKTHRCAQDHGKKPVRAAG